MRYAIFSDVHSNLEAFGAVLDYCQKERPDAYIFLGDVVGYGADPLACLALLRSLLQDPRNLALAGNHDWAVCGTTSMVNFVEHARVAVEWTARQLNDSDKMFLSALPLKLKTPDFEAVHANLHNPAAWAYVLNSFQAKRNFAILESPVCFIGHTHQPIIFGSAGKSQHFPGQPYKLEPTQKYIINVGSVGQPRDGDPRASLIIFDAEKREAHLVRIDYDVELAKKKIITAGLPEILGSRLKKGW